MENIIPGILDVSPFCCLLLDSDFNVIYANKKAAETFGDGLIGMHIDHFSPEQQSGGQPSADAIRSHLTMTAMLGKKRFAWEACAIDGTALPHPYEVDVASLNVDGKACLVLYYNVLGHNCVGCTNLKDKKDAEERMRNIIKYMPTACAAFDNQYTLMNANNATVNLYGMESEQELLEKHSGCVPEFQPDGSPSKKKALKLIHKAFEEGVTVFEWIDYDINGELLPSEVTLVRAESGGRYHVIAFIKDLRDSYKNKEIEYILMHRLETMLDSSPMVCTIFDETGNIIAANRKAEALFEIPDKQIYIDNFYEFSPKFQTDGTTSQEKAAEMLATAHKNGSANFAWLHQTRDGKPIPTEIHMKRVMLEGKNQIISYTRDLR